MAKPARKERRARATRPEREPGPAQKELELPGEEVAGSLGEAAQAVIECKDRINTAKNRLVGLLEVLKTRMEKAGKNAIRVKLKTGKYVSCEIAQDEPTIKIHGYKAPKEP